MDGRDDETRDSSFTAENLSEGADGADDYDYPENASDRHTISAAAFERFDPGPLREGPRSSHSRQLGQVQARPAAVLPRRLDGTGKTGGARWIVSLRALVVVLVMIGAALGVLWIESASVQSASAQLGHGDDAAVLVPPLGTAHAASAASLAPGAASNPESSSAGPPPTHTGEKSGTFGPLDSSGDGELVVHVAGAVQHPGVFTLGTGSRVFQALEAAGGATSEAELSALNLAAVIADASQIFVPTKEQASSLGANPEAAGVGGGQGGGVAGGPVEPKSLINVNTATAEELDALPGIGPVLAGRIVTWRTDHGPFATVDGLQAVAGIGTKLLAGIRESVVVS